MNVDQGETIDQETSPVLTSRNCPKCGTELELFRGTTVVEGAWVFARFYCSKCKEDSNYRVKPEQLRRNSHPDP